MRRAATILRVGGLLALFTFPSTVRSQEAHPAATASPVRASEMTKTLVEVTYENGRVSVKAEDAPLDALLKKIAEAAQIQIEMRVAVSEKVWVSFSGLTLEEAVDRVLSSASSRSYVGIYQKKQGGGESFAMEKIVVAQQGLAAGTAQPERARERLRNGKEIEFNKGQFFVRLLTRRNRTSGNQPITLTRPEMIQYIETKHSLRFERQIQQGEISYFDLFVTSEPIDHLATLRKLLQDPYVGVATLNGLGPDGATFDPDQFGRFHYSPNYDEIMNKEAYKYPETRGRFEFVASHLPWLHVKRSRGLTQDWPLPWVDGMARISFENIEFSRSLEMVLEICNDYGGVLKNHSSDWSDMSYYLYFPNHKGEKIFDLVAQLRKDQRLTGTRVGWESWGGWYRTGGDPYFGFQWSLGRVDAVGAWDYSTGNPNVTVAVIDTGIADELGNPQGCHEDFVPLLGGGCRIDYQRSKGFDVDGGPDDDLSDTVGHGTHVAGIIGAQNGNMTGIKGVAGGEWGSGGVTIVPIKVAAGDLAFEKAVKYAKAIGADVINISLGIEWFLRFPEHMEELYESGAVVVIAGPENDPRERKHEEWDTTFHWTDGTPNGNSLFSKILYVGATDEDDRKASFSAFGSAFSVGAPGTSILSLRADSTTASPQHSVFSDPRYIVYWGTSFAAPHVSGLAALVASIGGSQEHGYTAIVSGAEDPTGTLVPGGMGTGRINMFNTLDRVGSDRIAPMAPTNLVGRVENRKSVLTWDSPADDGDGNPLLDLYRYKIYRGKYPNFPIARQFFLCYSDGTSTTFTDTTAGDNAEYYYRVTAVDRAGNESAATASWSFATDYVLMFSRSSRWMLSSNPSESYFNAVGLLAGVLAEMMPDDSRVGVLVFRDQVYSSDPRLKPVTEAGLRGFSSGDHTLSALALPGVAPEAWRKDYWYLDISEVLLGGNGDAPWRDSALSSHGEAAANAVTLLAGEDGRNKVGILISDWYDNSLIGSANYANQQNVYDRWLTSIGEAEKHFDLKNVVLFGPGSTLPYPRDERYFGQGLQISQAGDFWSALGEEDVRFLMWDGNSSYETEVLRRLLHCRESVANVALQLKPGGASGSRCRSTPR